MPLDPLDPLEYALALAFAAVVLVEIEFGRCMESMVDRWCFHGGDRRGGVVPYCR
jgi:hypothetical protein